MYNYNLVNGNKMNKEKKLGNKRYTTLSIPTPLAQKIKKKIKGTGFTSLSSYVTYILRELVSGMDMEIEEAFTKEDEDRIKERLRALGYLD